MTAIGAQNPFAPPNASVEDHAEHSAEMVDASRGRRLLACLIDMAPFVVFGVVLGIGFAAYVASNPDLRMLGLAGVFLLIRPFSIVFGVVTLAWFVYNAVLAYRYGQIFGKRMMGIRVVRTDGSRASFARLIFLRWFPLAVAGGAIGAIAGAAKHPFISWVVTAIDVLLIFRASRLCLHDNIADTKVVTAASSESATLAGMQGAHLRTISF